MGKASRKARQAERRTGGTAPVAAPFVARPFEGLPGETDLVAMREIVPSATASLTLRPEAEAFRSMAEVPENITVATILPLAWPGLHRADGERLVGLQSGSTSGDLSRDVAQVLTSLLEVEPGTPVRPTSQATRDTPRLQDLLDTAAPLDVQVHDTFDFWVSGGELDAEGQASLEQANASIIPTVKLESIDSGYWCRVGERTHLRWILPHDESRATDALARLKVAGDDTLGENTRLLGAFRALGLLAPVWDLDPALEADAYEDVAAAMAERFAEALASDAPLTGDERRARAGLMSRQLTLR